MPDPQARTLSTFYVMIDPRVLDIPAGDAVCGLIWLDLVLVLTTHPDLDLEVASLVVPHTTCFAQFGVTCLSWVDGNAGYVFLPDR